MSFALFALIFLAYIGFLLFVLERTLVTGESYYAVLFAFCLLPVYQNLITFTYQHSNAVFSTLIQISKEAVFLLAFVVYFIYRRNIFTLKFKLGLLDWTFLGFLGLSFLYMLLPLGDASFVNKVIYFKNIFMFGAMYFLGRNCDFGFDRIRTLLHAVVVLVFIAFLFNCFERVTDTHLQSMIGYAKYHDEVNENDPTGNYGLTWTFEAQDGKKRFASIFTNPLDLSASMLIGFAVAFILFYQSRDKNLRWIYAFTIFLVLLNLSAAYSRASFASLFSVIFFIAIIFRVYKLIGLGVALAAAFTIYIVFFAAKETQYFVIDTLTFQNASSLGHVLEWLEAIESMITNPLGIGLATSGNAGGVESALQIGGENQFLIYGVQLGVIGMLLYTSTLIVGIFISLKAFRLAKKQDDQLIPFIASAAKFGLLLPLFTANIEIYLYVSFTTWWMVGFSATQYERLKRERVLEFSQKTAISPSR